MPVLTIQSYGSDEAAVVPARATHSSKLIYKQISNAAK